MMQPEILPSLNVSRETLDRLDSYVQLLKHWQGSINLIAPSTVEQIWERHIVDCAQVAKLFPDTSHWIDLGSGAGLPGMVVAIVRQALQPNFSMQLVEANGKKCSFLREAARLSGSQVQVHHGRIEDVLRNSALYPVDVVTARALAPLHRLLDMAWPALQRGAKAVFMKGSEVEQELTACADHWHIDAELIPSITEPKARLVVVHKASQAIA